MSILKSVKAGKYSKYTLFPTSKEELSEMIINEILNNGVMCSLNHIDVSKITDMSELFRGAYRGYGLENFIGDISEWDVSNVVNMRKMFRFSCFNGDLSQWDVSRVEDMSGLFQNSLFDNDSICNWNVTGVTDMSLMFYNTKFNHALSNWDISNVKTLKEMFAYSEFNQDISNWKIDPNCDTFGMFYRNYKKINNNS